MMRIILTLNLLNHKIQIQSLFIIIIVRAGGRDTASAEETTPSIQEV